MAATGCALDRRSSHAARGTGFAGTHDVCEAVEDQDDHRRLSDFGWGLDFGLNHLSRNVGGIIGYTAVRNSSTRESMEYQNPIAEIVSSKKQGDTLRTSLRLDKMPTSPIAPASLYVLDNEADPVLELHKVVQRTADIITFETYDSQATPLNIGSKYDLIIWWSADQLELAQDSSRRWQRQKFVPQDAVKLQIEGRTVFRRVRVEENVNEETLIAGGWEHEHCCLCWKTISLREGHENEGYTDGEEWLCKDCYEKYLVSGFGKRLGE